jgi:predicted alpha/beta hydrolase family esterase
MEFAVMSRDDPKQRAAFAAFEQSAKELESTAAEVVHAGHALFKDGAGEPTDPDLQRRYRLYKRVEAALAVPAGPKRVAALHAAIMGNRLQ